MEYLSQKKGFLGYDASQNIDPKVIVVPFGLEKTVSYGGGTKYGPKEIIKDGIIKLAQTTGAPIVPLFWKVKNHKLLNSWDNFIIPFPFSKGVYIFGEPIHINRKVTEKKLFQIKNSIQNEFDKLTKEVENYNFSKKINK